MASSAHWRAPRSPRNDDDHEERGARTSGVADPISWSLSAHAARADGAASLDIATRTYMGGPRSGARRCLAPAKRGFLHDGSERRPLQRGRKIAALADRRAADHAIHLSVDDAAYRPHGAEEYFDRLPSLVRRRDPVRRGRPADLALHAWRTGAGRWAAALAGDQCARHALAALRAAVRRADPWLDQRVLARHAGDLLQSIRTAEAPRHARARLGLDRRRPCADLRIWAVGAGRSAHPPRAPSFFCAG